MKKLAFTVAFLLVAVVYSQAQVQVKYGIRAGANISTWQGETMQSLSSLLDATNGSVSTQSRMGFHAGAYTSIQFGDRFALEPGLQYSLKGAEMTGRLTGQSGIFDLLNANARFRVESHYIEMPVLAKVYLTEGLHIFAGPQVAYLVDNKVNARASVLGFSALNRTFDINNGFQKWDFSGVAGVGYKFTNGVNVMAAYDYGFQRLDENQNFNTYNRAFKFSLGYEF
jgi:hypothetical protein